MYTNLFSRISTVVLALFLRSLFFHLTTINTEQVHSVFNWNLLQLPAETNFQVPRTWAAKRSAQIFLLVSKPWWPVTSMTPALRWSGLQVGPSWTKRADTQSSSDSTYTAIVACWGSNGWPTAIASSAAPAMLLLTPEVAPVQRGGNNVLGCHQQQDQPQNNLRLNLLDRGRRGRGGRRAN